MAATRAYRGVSADDRRDQRRAVLMDTVSDCLLDDGLSGVSVRAVCARARLTPRYFYENFADLDELLLAAVDAVIDEVAERSLAAVAAAGDDTAAQVRAAIETGYGIVADDRRKANLLLVAAAGDGRLRDRRNKMVTDYADLVIDGLSVLNAHGLAERRTARATALFLMGGSADVIEAVLSGRLRISRARVVDQLTAMWLGALTAGSGRTG
ncbi:MAG: TetR/AcrR family transcriptional regulator [Jatrophihabitans sp.]